LAAEFGTPLYVLDEDHLKGRARRFLAAAQAAWPGAVVSYASKANSSLAVLKAMHEAGLEIDVASPGELHAAIAAGVPASHCHLHGNFKTRADLEYAIAKGVGQIVVDSQEEIEILAEMGAKVPLLMRLAPGVDPKTHAKTSTGQADTKFGFNITNGAARHGLKTMLDAGLDWVGFHCHVGSQIMDGRPQSAAAGILAAFSRECAAEFGIWPRILNLGGGLGVRYKPSDQPVDVTTYHQAMADAVREAWGDGPAVQLSHEPGRWLVAESGVTLYSVGPVKTVPVQDGTRTYVAVDGGLSDNPRPGLYQAEYPVRAIPATGRTHEGSQTVRISGKHCETDQLFDGISVPANLAWGDLVEVACTGAYNASMASNYNRYPRPATVMLSGGNARVVVRRESLDDLVRSEI
jgi:diaminopimelate decarboxylase